MPSGETAANQVDQVDSLRVSLSRAETSFQTPVASLSGRASTRAETSPVARHRLQPEPHPDVRDSSSGLPSAERVQKTPKCAFCRKKTLSNELSHAGDNCLTRPGCAALRGFRHHRSHGFSHDRG